MHKCMYVCIYRQQVFLYAHDCSCLRWCAENVSVCMSVCLDDVCQCVAGNIFCKYFNYRMEMYCVFLECVYVYIYMSRRKTSIFVCICKYIVASGVDLLTIAWKKAYVCVLLYMYMHACINTRLIGKRRICMYTRVHCRAHLLGKRLLGKCQCVFTYVYVVGNMCLKVLVHGQCVCMYL